MVMPSCCHLGGQLRLGELHPVLHVHLIDVRIAAERESHVQSVSARAGARALHVKHVRHAVDLLLDRLADRFGDGLGAGAGIARRTDDLGGCRFGYCETGMADRARSPASVMTIEMTIANFGRLMKKPENNGSPALSIWSAAAGTRRALRRRGCGSGLHGLTGPHLLHARDNDVFPPGQALARR